MRIHSHPFLSLFSYHSAGRWHLTSVPGSPGGPPHSCDLLQEQDTQPLQYKPKGKESGPRLPASQSCMGQWLLQLQVVTICVDCGLPGRLCRDSAVGV